jgi:hypothetical protein
MHFGRLQTCKTCGRGYSVVWKRDPKTDKPVPLVVASAKPRSAKPQLPPESMIDLACNCGYRRKAAPEEARKTPTCPGCGKPMYVDRPPSPKKPLEKLTPYVEGPRFAKAPALPPRSTPPPFPAPRPPSSGAYEKVPSSSSNLKPPPVTPEVRPPSSGAYAKVPSSSSNLKVPPAAPPVRPPSSGAYEKVPPAAVPKVSGETRITKSGKIQVICTYCGDRLLVNADRQGGQVKCMACETVMAVPGPSHADWSSTARIPRAEEAPPPPPPPEPAPEPPPEETAFFEASEEPAGPRPVPEFIDGPTLGCPCGADLDVRGASPGSVFNCEACGRQVTMRKARHPQTLSTIMKPIFTEPEIVVDADTSDVICACGEALLVSSQDLGHPLQCPGCSVLLEVQRTPSGLQVKPIGRVDGQDWSLQDFS